MAAICFYHRFLSITVRDLNHRVTDYLVAELIALLKYRRNLVFLKILALDFRDGVVKVGIEVIAYLAEGFNLQLFKRCRKLSAYQLKALFKFLGSVLHRLLSHCQTVRYGQKLFNRFGGRVVVDPQLFRGSALAIVFIFCREAKALILFFLKGFFELLQLFGCFALLFGFLFILGSFCFLLGDFLSCFFLRLFQENVR